MNADTPGKPEPGAQHDPWIYDAADAAPYDLVFWDAPWPLEPAAKTTGQRWEPFSGPSRLTWVVLSLVVLLIALLLAARSAGSAAHLVLLLGVRAPAE